MNSIYSSLPVALLPFLDHPITTYHISGDLTLPLPDTCTTYIGIHTRLSCQHLSTSLTYRSDLPHT